MQADTHFVTPKIYNSPQSEEANCFGPIFHFMLILWVSQSDIFNVFRAWPNGLKRICATGINIHKKKSIFWASLRQFQKFAFFLLFKYLCFQGPHVGLERENRLSGKLQALDNKSGNKISFGSWCFSEGMITVDGVPPHPHSWFVRFPVLRSSSSCTSMTTGKGCSEACRQWVRDPRSSPLWRLAHVCVGPKWDTSPHIPKGADHEQSFFMFFLGAVFPGEGKQRCRPGLVSISAGWPSHPGGERNVRVSPPGFVQRRTSRQGFSGWSKAVEEGATATMSLCFWARGPGLEDKGFPGSQSRAQIVTPSPCQPGPRSAVFGPRGPFGPGGRGGLAGQPRQESGSDPGRSRGAEAEETEQLRAAWPGAFTSPGVKAGPLPWPLP